MKDIANGSEKDIKAHELYLDGSCKGYMPLCSLIDNKKSSKVLVLTTANEYLQQKNLSSNKYKDIYYDIFWCTHAYNHHTGKKTLIQPGVIANYINTNNIDKQQNNKTKSTKTRKRNCNQYISEMLQDALMKLKLWSIPSTLSCRTSEYLQIETYIKRQILCDGEGSGLYISGMPGTGKTTTVRQIVKQLKQLNIQNNPKKRFAQFLFYEINAMKLPSPQYLYTELCKKILQQNVKFIICIYQDKVYRKK